MEEAAKGNAGVGGRSTPRCHTLYRFVAMLYRSYRPAPPLSDFVDRFWFCSDAPLHPKERILPSGTIELVINLREDEFRIDDPVHPERCKRFSGAMVSGT